MSGAPFLQSTSLSLFTESEAALMGRQTSTEGIDQILDDSLRLSSRRPIMIQFEPSSRAIWRHWKGTVFAETWKSAVRHVLWASAMFLLFRRFPQISGTLTNFQSLYTQILSVTTFTLTFFVNESYTVWRTCLSICRTLQGRLNDLAMAIAGFAVRIDPSTVDGNSEFAPDSRRLLQVVARYIRLFNILCYASLTRSHRALLTPQGMRRMVARGLLTARERQCLVRANIPATQRHNAVLMWMLRTVIEGRKAGCLDGGFGFEQQMVTKTQEIRAQGNSMESVLRGRMVRLSRKCMSLDALNNSLGIVVFERN